MQRKNFAGHSGVVVDWCGSHGTWLDSDIYNYLRSDDQGRATFPSLIPGATYLLLAQGLGQGSTDLKKEFKVEPGQTLDLGDVLWPTKP